LAKVTRQKPAKKRTRKKPSSRLMDQAGAFEEEEFLRMVVYGRSGTGKTTLWSTFPKPIFAIICSGGKNAGEGLSIDPEAKKQIKRYDLQNCDDILGLSEELNEDDKYKTVVLDHASDLQDKRLAEILGLDSLPEQKDWGMASRDDYGERSLNMKTYLRSLFDISGKHVVIVAQEAEFDIDEVDDDSLIQPSIGAALSKSVVTWLNPAANQIVETLIRPKTETITSKLKKKTITKTRRVKDEFEYCLRTAPHDIYTTKFRVPKDFKKPSVIVDPSFEKIMDVIEGRYTDEQPKRNTSKNVKTKRRGGAVRRK